MQKFIKLGGSIVALKLSLKIQFLTNMHHTFQGSSSVSCFSSKLVKNTSLGCDSTEKIDISTSFIEGLIAAIFEQSRIFYLLYLTQS